MIGVIENMGPLTDAKTGTTYAPFGEGGGQKLAGMKNVPFLGSVPFEPLVRIGGDMGKPVVLSQPDSESAKAIIAIAKQVAARVSVLNFSNTNTAPEINIIG